MSSLLTTPTHPYPKPTRIPNRPVLDPSASASLPKFFISPQTDRPRYALSSPSLSLSSTSYGPQPQMIVFDVSQPLDEIQAPRDAVQCTAMAIVKQDSVFLSGTPIGATHWLAYALTRGRVRVISRSNGDHTLLQLPAVFSRGAQVIDMAMYGNRLAGVTSDGGFVVWELPEVITNDVPGHILLCIVPSADDDLLRLVKWHPEQTDTLVVASETKMYLLDLADAARTFQGEPQPQVGLDRISQVFSLPSRLVAFDFDVPHLALATISVDSTLTLWDVHDRSPFWTHRVRGDDLPSSLTYIDDGIVIGRKNGTVFQLLSVITKNVLSTFRFANGTEEDPDMFGHVNYDSRIQTLWVANNRRDSLIALKIAFDVSALPSGEPVRDGFVEQVVEFSGPKPTIHFDILSADAEDQAHAACVAASLPPGEVALVAFSANSTGVDQVLVRKEWYEGALVSAVAKFPLYTQSQVPASARIENMVARQPRKPSDVPNATEKEKKLLYDENAQLKQANEELRDDLAKLSSQVMEIQGKYEEETKALQFQNEELRSLYTAKEDDLATAHETLEELRNQLQSVQPQPSSQTPYEMQSNTQNTLPSALPVDTDDKEHVRRKLPFVHISDAVFDSWMRGELTRAEELLTGEFTHPFQHPHAIAQRALVRNRLQRVDEAVDDAKMSLNVQRSVIGYIASAVACVAICEHESALDVFDCVFSHCRAGENTALLLIRAIILFESQKHGNAISRVDSLIDTVDDKSPYIAVRAQMFLLRSGVLLRDGEVDRAMELLQRARDAMPVKVGPLLIVVSLVRQPFPSLCRSTDPIYSMIFGWEFDKLDIGILMQIRGCIKPVEDLGDTAVQAKNPSEAVLRYSAALSLDPSNPAGILVKRSKAHWMLQSWEDALKDADEAIKADPGSPLGYDARHSALHALRRYDEALDALACMFSLIEDTSHLANKYISPSRSMNAINEVIHEVAKISPLVLIDVESGHLCDGLKRKSAFKSEPEFKELVSSMKEVLDGERIQCVVQGYFRYVTLSHVWEGREPSLQDVNQAGSVWDLDPSSPLNEKLQKFCEEVRKDGYRWCWSDACCIDKTISTVLNQSLKMMYKWYESSAATFVFLRDVETLSSLLGLKDSKWMMRSWTSQELLSPNVIRFYTHDWKPYLGDTRRNHKESPEILQELTDTIKIARKTIVNFNPDDLTVREKLRLASTRSATVEEDVAYSLIGIFKSDIRPEYGEGYAALGHLLEEIVARSGEVTVLDWTGESSPYNTCLPSSLKVYGRPPGPSPTIDDAEMEGRVAGLKDVLPQADSIIEFHKQITSLNPARFANRRLHLPCIIFPVRRLGLQHFGEGNELRYRARVSGIGYVDFQTSDKLSPSEPRKLIFVHPWIRDLCDPSDGFTWRHTADDDGDGGEFEYGPDDEDGSQPPSPLHAVPAAAMDEYTRALRLIVRLQKPFRALLLQEQSRRQFKRVAAECEIIVPGVARNVDFSKDVLAAEVEIL